jgi:hypothetical protein
MQTLVRVREIAASSPISSIMSPNKSSSDAPDDISVDSDVAFAFVDFTGVDFGDNSDEIKHNNTSREMKEALEEIATHQEVNVAKAIRKQYADLPGGQEPNQNHEEHDPILFAAQTRRVENLIKWYELGIRPSLSSSSLLNQVAHADKDQDILSSENDNLSTLLLRSLEAQDERNTNLPPHPTTKYENQLKVSPSTIEGAGNGLFASSPIPKGETICHYTGYRHDYQSQKRLRDRSYILKLQNGWPKFDRKNDGFVDALPCPEVLARYINDPRREDKCNVKFEHIQQPGIWHCPVVALRDIDVGEELFVSYGPRYWVESRMIGG